MRSARTERRHSPWAVAVLLALVAMAACDRDRTGEADGEEPALAPDTGRALHLADPELATTCDSLEQWVRRVVPRGLERLNGGFTGSARGGTRYGCRITANDTLPPDAPQRPLETVWQTLASRGWVLEQEYMADGPEGSMLGLRSGSQLCVLAHSWTAASDDERAARPDMPVPYDVSVECFREAARPQDAAR